MDTNWTPNGPEMGRNGPILKVYFIKMVFGKSTEIRITKLAIFMLVDVGGASFSDDTNRKLLLEPSDSRTRDWSRDPYR